jgi:hypothetical protein
LLSLPLKRANLAGATAIAIAVLRSFNTALIDVPVLDYIVLGNKAISFAKRGLLYKSWSRKRLPLEEA